MDPFLISLMDPCLYPIGALRHFYQSRYARGCDPNHSVSSPRRCSVRLTVIQGLMDVEQFRASVKHGAVPGDLAPPLAALWWDAKGDWIRAHGLVDQLDTLDGMAVHAYLHRKEGDVGNADYWYRRAGRRFQRASFDAEWEALAAALLAERE